MRERLFHRICSKARPLWAILLAIITWLFMVVSLEAFFRIQISRFEKKVAGLTEGMTEDDVLDVLGKPESANPAAYYWPTQEQVPQGEAILDYCYSMRSFLPYSIGGIYIDAKSKRLVRLSPHRLPDFFMGSWPSNFLFISFLIITALAWVCMKRICLRNSKMNEDLLR